MADPDSIGVEMHRPFLVSHVLADGVDVQVEATAVECAALAERMQLPAIHALSCRFHLKREPASAVGARGHLQARIVQTCVVSLEDFETTVEEYFSVRFVPAGTETDDPDPETDDEIPYEDGVLDLGEAAAEQLGLALDPYPRMPDAELPEIEEEAEPHPFAALARLQRPH